MKFAFLILSMSLSLANIASAAMLVVGPAPTATPAPFNGKLTDADNQCISQKASSCKDYSCLVAACTACGLNQPNGSDTSNEALDACIKKAQTVAAPVTALTN